MKVYIETLGCPKNTNDSQMFAGILKVAGHEIAEDFLEAEAIVVNTCGFINDAKKESIERILDFSEAKSDDMILVVSGCLSERYAEDLFNELPEVDIMLGVNDYELLPELLENFDGERKLCVSHKECNFLPCKYRDLPENSYSATLKIAEGCDNRCAYCIIPFIRGRYRSRAESEILEEAEFLASKGIKELILIAQDVTYYGVDLCGRQLLPELLRKLCKIEGIEWIRLMYCYEDRIDDELINVMASEPKICHYIDIPIQHASDKILKGMKRRSTRSSIEKTISRLRKAMPDIHIRTTLITGFPGEKALEFDELYDFVCEMKFERLGIFAYSKEEGTEAGEMKPQVRRDVAERRKDTLMRAQLEISLENNRRLIGKTLEVLIEGIDEEGAFVGRTRYDAPEIDNSVIFTSDKKHEVGEIVLVEIDDAFDYDLVGKEI